ncbi:SDR family oxidoreductase [Desulfonatronospira sp.]|uniref:SDR family oxidoreductase n=1 Tax=Desulfonatronospira sp. TaxID=1962951 RepID=UPI0025BC56A7|nr:SDR family oxidoreductase [Desulfonatronospira sp.]
MSKPVLILGAGSDIARALGHELAAAGHDLYLAGRHPEELEKDARDLQLRYSINARGMFFDALDFDSHQTFYESLEPGPYGLVLAFGLLGEEDQARKTRKHWEKIIHTNYTGCISILTIAANHLEQAGEGFILGISSVAGDRGRKANYVYGSAKAGLSTFLSGLRNRLHSKGVRVITVKPGFVRTRMTRDMDLPARLTASPEQAARDIFKAIIKQKEIVYTRWMWRWIMLVIKCIPERVFKRMSI